ncbi:hypothetical protein GCM10022297_16540 [Lactobacillus hamsteri]
MEKFINTIIFIKVKLIAQIKDMFSNRTDCFKIINVDPKI